MEFMKEYPDDATCLEVLWRRRYSPDGEHADCPKCEMERSFKRYETKQQRQSLDLYRLWAPSSPNCGNHLPQVVHVPSLVVLRPCT